MALITTNDDPIIIITDGVKAVVYHPNGITHFDSLEEAVLAAKGNQNGDPSKT